MTVRLLKEKQYVNQVVDVHMKSFTGFFLTFLGKGFLKQLYLGYLEHEKSGLIVVVDEDEKIVGFCAFSEQVSQLYKYLIKRKLPLFAWYALGGFLRKPNVFFRLIRAFGKSGEAKRKENYIELASIGVLPSAENRGIGSQMIHFLKDMYKQGGDKFSYIKLETDAVANEKANIFYQKNDFVLDHVYLTPEGREMNEYRYYLR